jgi:hypothetical protein
VKHNCVPPSNEEIDEAFCEDTEMEVHVDDNDDDWGDTQEGDSGSESENDSGPQQSRR